VQTWLLKKSSECTVHREWGGEVSLFWFGILNALQMSASLNCFGIFPAAVSLAESAC